MPRTLPVLATLLVLAVAGCGGDEEGSSATSTPAAASGGGQQLALAAPEDGSLKFDKSELEAEAGALTISFDNPSSTPHAVEIEGADAKSDTVTEGKTSLTAELEAGTYDYFCPVGNHASAGMEGTLTVR